MWSEYHTFLVAAQTLNFSRAAERLGQNTSSISRAVTRLEEHLGLRLFNRMPSMRLTDPGERLYSEIAPLFEGLQEVESAIKSDDEKIEDVSGSSDRPRLCTGLSTRLSLECWKNSTKFILKWRPAHACQTPLKSQWMSTSVIAAPK